LRERAQPDRPVVSPREGEVLRLIADGRTNPEIAAALFISASTVKTHVKSLCDKLGVSDRSAAVAEAMRRRIIE
jgi:two-component system nitrate/nitrite response regulator NarL